MEKGSGILVKLIRGVWNKQADEQEWKGSWPEWKWGQASSVNAWMNWRRRLEGAENLWRIHDKLYDLDTWSSKHPGGSSWITASKGTDITEAFECHHFSGKAEATLPSFYVREAKTSRNSPFTFDDDGLFRTLKREVKKYLEAESTTSKSNQSKLLTDSLFVSTLLLAILGASYNSYTLCILSGLALCFLTICGHNYFHQKDNFRMYYFNLSLLSFRDWRISHVFSHHLYPNSRYDLEVTLFVPFLQWFPRSDKTLFTRYGSWLYSPIAYAVIFHKQWVERVFVNPDGWVELIPLVYPATMISLGGASAIQAFTMWNLLTLVGSFFFILIGLNAGHHHPDIFHDGDYPRENKDWGLYELDAVRDRLEYKGSVPLIMLTFGDHTLHHIFPTLDHSDLDALHPILSDVCKRFGYDIKYTSHIEHIKGQFQQLARTDSRSNCSPLNPIKI